MRHGEARIGAQVPRHGARQRLGIEPRQVGHQPHPRRLARRQMQRNVAAVVHPGAGDAGPLVGGDQFLRHGTGHGRHRREKTASRRTQRGASGPHPPRHQAAQRVASRIDRLAQPRQFGHQITQQWLEAHPGRRMGGRHRIGIPLGGDHDVDRPVLQMPAPARQGGALRCPHRHQPSNGGRPSGQGLPGAASAMRRTVGAPSACQAPVARACSKVRT